jgi:hypothetical protein
MFAYFERNPECRSLIYNIHPYCESVNDINSIYGIWINSTGPEIIQQIDGETTPAI